ncbi:ribose-phosphate pyrophosphokinase [Acetobacter sacchari]|uniref:Ribose-phosphate pyrophosphokinase n=1 Tax=Acetobacter sacchari TaxID=2661687 RepID=A0ABS3M102_9PROT|nr:ribose-phosphate pyrophosphokinase-like domain-containing protein [Acetobacter sacchari]MBO1361836.1 ribose-phosphate pyrophosphokinase [Acetobacter sacchari]
MIRVFQWSTPVEIDTMTFAGGERHVRLSGYQKGVSKNWVIKAAIHKSDDLIDLLLVADAIHRLEERPTIHLFCPYIPFARQDRVCFPGEAMSLAVMARLLNSASFNYVEAWDVHSPMAQTLITNFKSVPAAQFVGGELRPGEVVVAPDKGAVLRAREAAGDTHPVIVAEKNRNPDNGALFGFHLPTDFEKLDTSGCAIVVDDICDGGRTFVGIGEMLRERVAGSLRLYVTHGIFSHGFNDLLNIYDEILVANLMTDAPLPKQVRHLQNTW